MPPLLSSPPGPPARQPATPHACLAPDRKRANPGRCMATVLVAVKKPQPAILRSRRQNVAIFQAGCIAASDTIWGTPPTPLAYGILLQGVEVFSAPSLLARPPWCKEGVFRTSDHTSEPISQLGSPGTRRPQRAHPAAMTAEIARSPLRIDVELDGRMTRPRALRIGEMSWMEQDPAFSREQRAGSARRSHRWSASRFETSISSTWGWASSSSTSPGRRNQRQRRDEPHLPQDRRGLISTSFPTITRDWPKWRRAGTILGRGGES